MKYLILIISIIGLFYTYPVFAHPGRTDSNGGHTCRTNCPDWGLSYGEYHYHNSGNRVTHPPPPAPKPTPIPPPVPTSTFNPTSTQSNDIKTLESIDGGKQENGNAFASIIGSIVGLSAFGIIAYAIQKIRK